MPPKDHKPDTTRGPELRELMEKYGLKPEDVARALERRPSTVRVWLCGAQGVPADALALLKLKMKGRRARPASEPNTSAA